jgi:hypothetical protein
MTSGLPRRRRGGSEGRRKIAKAVAELLAEARRADVPRRYPSRGWR